ncbi:UVR8, partial [Symbiodinium necroappetens]
MAVDEFSVGPAESAALSCDFELDVCSWEFGSWQRVSGRDAAGQPLANDGDWHLEAGGTSQPAIFVLESPVILTSNAVAFTLAYRIIGSEGAKLELQHKTENSTWIRLFVQAGHQGHRWQHAAINIPQGSTALRITATTAMAEDSVFVDSLYALDMVPEVENLSCRFTGADLCGWTTGTWRRDSNDYVFYIHHQDVGQAKLTSRPFLVQGPSYVEFWYGTSGHPGTLTLEFLMRGRWWRLWSQTGPHGDQWNEAKLSVPEQARQFRFRTSEWPTSTNSASAFYLWSITLSKTPASRSYLTLAVGGNHNCAVLSSTGQVKCWGFSSYLGLGLSTSAGVGDDPDEMGVNLPIVDLGERVEQVTCDNFDCCAVLADGALKCWGSESALPSLVDLGTGVKVRQVSNGYQHRCALLQDGAVKCWGWNDNGQLGLGDSQTRGRGGDSDMGDNLPAIDLGADFTVSQLTAGIFHTCALSSDGEVKCWGGNQYSQLGGSAGNIGDQPGTMGTSLAPMELGSKATYIAAAGGHSCAVLESGAAVCWGANWNGQLGLGSTQAFGQNSSEMGANMPHVPLGTGMFAKSVSVSPYHSCAILQDASLKCWGSGAYGTLGQGSTDDLGDEPNEMGDNLRPINIGSLRVLQVGVGGWHTCALFDDDSTRCWGRSAPRGTLGTGSGDNVGDGANEMGSNLVAADLFRPTLREQVDGFRLRGGDERQGWLELSQNGTWGVICDDAWFQSTAAAEAACRDLGMAGGTPLSFDAGSAPILADGMKCSEGEVTLRDCTFRGVQCELDTWSSFTAPGPSGRQDHTMAWDSVSQSALLLGGHASSQFLHFSDLWQYRWPLRRWTQLHPQGSAPTTRSGHSAVFDAHSKSMLVFAGGHLGNFYNELWQFLMSSTAWQQLASVLPPAPRAKHSAVWDAKRQGMVVFGGHNPLALGDLSHYDMRRNTWSSLAAGPVARSGHAAVWEPVTASLLVCGGWTGTEYLQDLQLYNWWSNTWKELEPVGSPWPRAGHAAVWDEASMSMLVFGGVEDSNGTLNYDPVLHFYNFLANSWTEANRSGPTGRTDPSVVWDSSTQALLAFGGFNSSYLDDLWRYVTSPLELPL